MGTNYYCRIIPSKKRKKELYDAMEANDFHMIKKLTDELYGSLTKDFDNNLIRGEVHLGKRSGGWKFLWDPNIYIVRHGHSETKNGTYKWIEEPSTAICMYPLTKKGLHDFIFRKDVLIYDEYDELQNKENFWKMALEWEQPDGWDAAAYEAHEKGYTSYPVTGELTEYLKKERYKFTSYTNSDFYSDGLRFTGFTDFS